MKDLSKLRKNYWNFIILNSDALDLFMSNELQQSNY